MKKKFILLTLVLSIFVANISSAANISMKNTSGQKDLSLMVAHAGGGIYGFKLTNSLEALNNSYNNGFRYIEMDFNWTTDGVPVAIHDWDLMVKRLFNLEPKVLSHAEFKNYNTFQNLSLMDINDVVKWLEGRPDPFIITDVKEGNIEFLKYVAENFPHVKARFIPQIYSMEEYEEAKALGYNNIILTLYMSNYTDDEIVNFAMTHPLYGVTMHYSKAYGELPNRLNNLGVKTYIHTVNELYIFEELAQRGIRGFYTDYFQVNQFPYM